MIFPLMIILGLLVRFVIASFFYGPWDMESVQIIADLLKHGSLVYNDTWRYDSPPVWMWLISLLSIISDFTKTPLSFWSKTPFILSDLAICLLIYKIATKFQIKKTVKMMMISLYFFNPLSFLTSAYQGQLESMFLLMMAVASWLLIQQKEKNLNFKKTYLSAMLLGIAATIKLVPLGFLPAYLLYLYRYKLKLLSFKKKAVIIFNYASLAVIPLLLSFLPYLSVWDSIVAHVVHYKTAWGIWGISLALRLTNIYWAKPPLLLEIITGLTKNQTLMIMSLLTFSYLVIWYRKLDLTRSILMIILTELAISPFLAPQYLLWIVPFWLIGRLEKIKLGSIYSFMGYSLLGAIGTIVIFLYWKDPSYYSFLGNIFHTTDLEGLYTKIYAVFIFATWMIIVKWWLTLLWENNKLQTGKISS